MMTALRDASTDKPGVVVSFSPGLLEKSAVMKSAIAAIEPPDQADHTWGAHKSTHRLMAGISNSGKKGPISSVRRLMVRLSAKHLGKSKSFVICL